MRRNQLVMAAVVLVLCAGPAAAGILFGRHPKPSPAERVPQLLGEVKTATDDGKRESAAKELRDYDPAAFPEMIPVLIDVMQHDAKPAVRSEAAQTLGKLRPVSPTVGLALEEAEKDPSIRVRMQARTSLWSYRLSGYRSPEKPAEAAAPVRTTKPPAKTEVKAAPPLKRLLPAPAPQTTSKVVVEETAPPPLAEQVPSLGTPRPLPQGVTRPATPPTTMPLLRMPPPAVNDQGPDIPPQ